MCGGLLLWPVSRTWTRFLGFVAAPVGAIPARLRRKKAADAPPVGTVVGPRALARLRTILEAVPGLLDGAP